MGRVKSVVPFLIMTHSDICICIQSCRCICTWCMHEASLCTFSNVLTSVVMYKQA